MKLKKHPIALNATQLFDLKNVLPFFLCIVLAFMLSSCGPNSTGKIPAYLYLGVPEVTTTASQGSASHNITDIWVYIDNNLLGVYELPAKVPVIADGITNVRLSTGVKLNGISSTRAMNPFYQDIVYDFEFVPGEIDTPDLQFQYRSDAVFSLNEDFESGNAFELMQRITEPQEFIFEGIASGIITVNEDFPAITSKTIDKYTLPGGGRPVFLELNYKTSARLLMGISFTVQGFEQEYFLLGFNRRDDWGKLYINLTPQATEAGGGDFRVIFRAELPAGETEAEALFDNIKLIYL